MKELCSKKNEVACFMFGGRAGVGRYRGGTSVEPTDKILNEIKNRPRRIKPKGGISMGVGKLESGIVKAEINAAHSR